MGRKIKEKKKGRKIDKGNRLEVRRESLKQNEKSRKEREKKKRLDILIGKGRTEEKREEGKKGAEEG